MEVSERVISFHSRDEVEAYLEEYNKPENRIARIKEFIDSLPDGRSLIFVRVQEHGEEDKFALLGGDDFKEFLKDYDRISKLVG